MRPMRIVVFCVVLTLGAAASARSVQIASAQPASPAIVLPSNGATLLGTQYLDVVASGATQVQYELTGGSLNNQVIATWRFHHRRLGCRLEHHHGGERDLHPQQRRLLSWRVIATSTPITITVDNPPPSTAVIIPSNNVTRFWHFSVLTVRRRPA